MGKQMMLRIRNFFCPAIRLDLTSEPQWLVGMVLIV